MVRHLTVAVAILAAAGCVRGPRGDAGAPGAAGTPGSAGVPFAPTSGDKYYDPPGVVLTITSVTGGSAVGSAPTVTFTIRKNDGTPWNLEEMAVGNALVSGPTFNYQRVITEQSDLLTASVNLGNGSYRYTFPVAMPSTYAAPVNDTTSFGAGDGELAGQALLAGTYTVYIRAYWNYTVEGVAYKDPGEATADFLFDGASTLQPREVVLTSNCNRCHQSVREHGGTRRDVKACVLCHTSGAEDNNNPTLGGGTPGRSADFRVLIHKLHNGAHLPSVLGVATNTDGSRNYSATPVPYQIAGGSSVHDFSTVGYPEWPHLSHPMPRDQGHSSLSAANQALEDTIRRGVTNCASCHAGAAQGNLYKTQPSRRACQSCHDDWDPTRLYVSNGQTMAAQTNDSSCVLCHAGSGSTLAIDDAHLHPLKNAALNPGLNITVTSAVEAGTNDGDGTLDPGEKVAVTLSIADDAGAAVAPSSVASMSVVVSGPTTNRQLLLSTSIPVAALTGSAPYTINLPEPVVLERVGLSTATAGETFTTARTPHWNMTGATTTVRVRTATAGGNTTLSAATAALTNTVTVASVASFARNDYVVLDDGTATEEYTQVTLVDGTNRLWLSPPLRYAHALNGTVQEVTLTTMTVTTDYTLTAATGQVTEVTEFGAGNAVVVSYTSDFLVPSVYPPPLNDSPDLDETWGEWTGKSLVSGTYTVGLWGYRNVTVTLFSETQTYRGTSLAGTRDILVGSATTMTPYSFISSAANCNACHDNVMFHGGSRRGFDTCILCHGTSAPEDRARYTAANAPATTGVTIQFRNMLHKIHRGSDLANAATYTVNGFGASAYPNNFTAHTYDEVGFPAMPGGVRQCTVCHGSTNVAWKEPSNRDHPTSQGSPVRSWRAVCLSCHDSSSAQAHADLQTSGLGVESCAVCHGTTRDYNVPVSHKAR
ncbi:MAG: hypothetical protein L0216_10010 [Planctomycetales bacterium]|nr:hypothetical protein [Planctomycetales bacterium]